MHGVDLCATHIGRSTRRPLIELEPELVDALLVMLRAGNYVEVACRAVGMARSTFDYFLARARDGDERYTVFAADVERARATGEARNVAAIAHAAREQWQAAAWLLERTYPDRWARVSQRSEPEPAPKVIDPADPFAEVDELAARRTRVS